MTRSSDSEAGFEDAVKGIGAGIVGRFKEMAGEILEDPDLEEEGIVQQLDGKLRRADPVPEGGDEPAGPERSTADNDQ